MSSSAGTMEGDVQCYDINLGDNTNMELTSQSFEKIYTMVDEDAYRECNLTIGSNSLLKYNLLPVIPFKDSAFKSDIKISLKDKTSRLIFTDIINCGRVAYGEKFQYKYYKSYVEAQCNNRLIYLDNTIYKPSEMDMNNFGMYEGYTHFANILIVNFNRDENLLTNIREVLNNDNIDGAASFTQNQDISVKILGHSADSLIKISEKISDILLDSLKID